jgi:hypothetical protein
MINEILRNLGQLLVWIVVVAPWEQAIRVRAGKHTKVLGPGMYVRFPFVDRVHRQSTRRRLSAISAMTLTTKCGRTITVSAYVGYAIGDLFKLYNSLHHAEDTIEAEVASKMAGFIVSRTLAECGPDLVEQHVRSAMRLEQYGLKDPEFFINNWAAVKTYRFLMGEPRNWIRSDDQLNTEAAEQAKP